MTFYNAEVLSKINSRRSNRTAAADQLGPKSLKAAHIAEVSALTKAAQKALLLSILAALLALFSDSAEVFAFVVVIVSGIAFWDLYLLLAYPRQITFAQILGVSILLGYGLGALIYCVANGTWHATDDQYWSNEGLFFDQAHLALALAVSLLASAGLFILGAFQKPVRFPTIETSVGATHQRLVWSGLILTSVAIARGDLGYMGAIASDAGHVAPLGAIANLIVPALVPYTVLLLVMEKRLNRRLALTVALVVFGTSLVLMGRRYLLYSIVMSFVALGIGGLSLRTLKRRTLLLFALSALLLYEGSRAFMAVRLAGWSLQPGESLVVVAKEAIPLLAGEQQSALQEALIENSGSRPFILSYFAGLMQATRPGLPLLGAEFGYSLQMTVPSFLMPSKLGGLASSPEELVHPYYGISIFDAPGSILVSGYDDFGWFGTLLYPLALVILYSGFYRMICALTRDPFLRIFVWFALGFQLLFIEQGLAEQVVTLRNLVIVVSVGLILTRFPLWLGIQRNEL